MFITKKHLPRRTFLRGLGVTVALPLLDSMLPAQTAFGKTAAAPPPASASSTSRTARSWINGPLPPKARASSLPPS